MNIRRTVFILTVFIVALMLAACGGSTGENVSQQQLPEYVRNAPHTVQVAYQFALEYPQLLVHQPCYCGCGPIGHTSSLHCFIRGVTEQGQIVFDSHGVGCGICVDIALDVKRLSEQGLSPLEVRHYIDATYGFYGPPTDTAMPDA